MKKRGVFVCLRGTFFFFFFFFLVGLWLGWVRFCCWGLSFFSFFSFFILILFINFHSCRNTPWFLPHAIRLLERLDKQRHIELIRGLERRTNIISPSFSPHLHTPSPPLSPHPSPSLISLVVSVDVKHHVYVLIYLHPERCTVIEGAVLAAIMTPLTGLEFEMICVDSLTL